MKYFILDIDGFVVYQGTGDILPPDCVIADIDIGNPPGPGYLYHYPNKTWIQSPDQLRSYSLGKQAKENRDKLLYESDWTQLPNGPLTTQQQQSWVVYRQQLRDITSQSGYPFKIIWPTPPQG